MLQGMTDLLVNIGSRRDVMELLYLETAETNLIYALGKYIHACSSRREANITVSIYLVVLYNSPEHIC